MEIARIDRPGIVHTVLDAVAAHCGKRRHEQAEGHDEGALPLGFGGQAAVVAGKAAEAALGKAAITVNKNAIPFDQNPPMVASGVRIGTPAVTSRGMREPEMDRIAELITRALASPDDDRALQMVKTEVETLCRNFPLYPDPTN